MDKPLVSSFDSNYYFKAIFGAVVFLGFTAYMLYHCVLGDFAHPEKAYPTMIVLCAADCCYYYFFSRSWKTVTITDTEIIIYDLVFKKKITVPFTDITAINTYHTRGNPGRGGGVFFSRDFVIEYNHDQWTGFNEAWYDNYNKLTMAIYNRRYGPGHGRERYLARHGQS